MNIREAITIVENENKLAEILTDEHLKKHHGVYITKHRPGDGTLTRCFETIKNCGYNVNRIVIDHETTSFQTNNDENSVVVFDLDNWPGTGPGVNIRQITALAIKICDCIRNQTGLPVIVVGPPPPHNGTQLDMIAARCDVFL